MGSNVHILAKPIGSLCNLNCEYCFYTEKKALYPNVENFRMSDQVLETFISKYIKAQPNPEVQFVWQGGEPTLLGVDFFRRAVELEKKYAGGKKIVNSLFSCDHYVYPDYQLGNILTASPQDLVASEKQCLFRRNKSLSLPQYCKDCAAYFACRGECPKHRFLHAPDGEFGLNYLCAGYKKYFRHIHPYMKVMRQLIENDLPATKVMEVIKGPLLVKRKK
jgi:radical SAM protein with 4Fe4S-binding SPASM domain